MADWSPLRAALTSVPDRVTYSWAELEALVGSLPRSAYDHDAYWKGDRTGWPGFTTTDVRVGRSVTFVRRGGEARTPRSRPVPVAAAAVPRRALSAAPDLVLVGCVKTKLDRPAPARDLYVSPLFRKARAYAEQSGAPWFILSAEHGLVSPDTVLDPYNRYLPETSRDYRAAWGRRVVADLGRAAGTLAGKVVEAHAGMAYTRAIEAGLHAAGAELVEPLAGLGLGQRLAWYDVPAPTRTLQETAVLTRLLSDSDNALSPAALLATGGAGLDAPGLYSWWVDDTGARDLAFGLGVSVDSGLIYAGLAGATRARSGRPSSNTLWGRIRGMHLGGRHSFSTFRLSLGSILAQARGEPAIDETALTAWMHEHLRVVAVPVDDADTLGEVETEVLALLDPPLNLDKRPRSELRERLSRLRKRYKD